MSDRPPGRQGEEARSAPTSEPIVLVIEDELPIRRFLRTGLPAEGYRVIEAVTGDDGLREAATRQPDIVLLDLGLPDLDGLEVIRRLRAWSTVPIIVVSARGQERDKVAALDTGADDYLSKPFGMGELLARLRVARRHTARFGREPTDTPFRVGDLTVDLVNRRVRVRNREVTLTPTEYRLLATLIRHVGKVLTHRQLLQEVWGPASIEQTDSLRAYMKHLRHKLEANPAQPRFLLTEPGVGYRLLAE